MNNTPRVALFAGENGIMTGEELTYDYNFNPYSMKNVQECRCGSEDCRGKLGPNKKPKEPKEALKPIANGGNRNFQAVLEDAIEGALEAVGVKKRRKTIPPKGPKKDATPTESNKSKKLEKKPKKPVEKPLPKGWIYPEVPADFNKTINDTDPEAILRARKRKIKEEEKEDEGLSPAKKRRVASATTIVESEEGRQASSPRRRSSAKSVGNDGNNVQDDREADKEEKPPPVRRKSSIKAKAGSIRKKVTNMLEKGDQPKLEDPYEIEEDDQVPSYVVKETREGF